MRDGSKINMENVGLRFKDDPSDKMRIVYAEGFSIVGVCYCHIQYMGMATPIYKWRKRIPAMQGSHSWLAKSLISLSMAKSLISF